MTKTMNIDDLILLADAFVLPVDVKVSHGLFRRGVSLGSVLRSIKTHAQCQTATAYDEGNMEEIARDSDLAEIEALRKRIDFAADALGVVERRRDTLKAERDTARAALRIFVSRAKSWHDFHHGSDTIQCDALCEAIPIGEAALGSPPEPNEHPPAAPQRGTLEPTALATGEGADTGVLSETLSPGNWRPVEIPVGEVVSGEVRAATTISEEWIVCAKCGAKATSNCTQLWCHQEGCPGAFTHLTATHP